MTSNLTNALVTLAACIALVSLCVGAAVSSSFASQTNLALAHVLLRNAPLSQDGTHVQTYDIEASMGKRPRRFIPDHPLSTQATAPCKPPAKAINGGCWVQLDATEYPPPCPEVSLGAREQMLRGRL